MARLDRAVLRGTASGPDGPAGPGHDGRGPGHDDENSKLTRYPPMRGAAVVCYCVCTVLLCWPALWNGYPIVFADTGTYLHQAMHRSLGWDRPPFYSLAIFPLHQGVTLWPVIVAQAALSVWVLDLTRRAFGLPRAWLPVLVAFLSVTSWFPWIVSELMPDLFTPLMILLLCGLVFAPERFGARERLAMTSTAAFMIASQQSSVLLSLALLGLALPLRWFLRRTGAGSSRIPANPRQALIPLLAPPLLAPALLAPALAILALVGVNMVGHGRIALSPYGNVFLLARVIYDGPGLTVLRRDCPGAGWRLCPHIDRFPPTSDEFLWEPDSPILLAGGHKAVSAEADAILQAALRAEPGRALRAALNNTLEQLTRFESGDGLDIWEHQAGARIDRDFPPRERAAYHAARQQQGALWVPLAHAHAVVGVSGIVAAALLLLPAWRRRHAAAGSGSVWHLPVMARLDRGIFHGTASGSDGPVRPDHDGENSKLTHYPAAGFLAMTLLALPISAAITGALSTPHDRYQSRILFLPACAALLAAPALVSRRAAPSLVPRRP